MIGKHHHGITRLAAERHGIIDPAAIEEVVAGSSYPDEVSDLFVVLGGQKRFRLFEQNLASFTHFTADSRGGGYCWRRDPTAKWLEVPDTSVRCDPSQWVRDLCPFTDAVGGFRVVPQRFTAWGQRHPQLLYERSGADLALDETTYANGANMGGWLGELLTMRWTPRAFGAYLHVLQDACSRPHVLPPAGRLLIGHTKWEAQAWDAFLRENKTGRIAMPAKSWPGFRRAVELAANVGRKVTPAGGSQLALRWTLFAFSEIWPAT